VTGAQRRRADGCGLCCFAGRRAEEEESMKPKIAIIGDGHVGSALERGLKRAGYDVRAVGNDARTVRETANAASVVVIAVPFTAVDDALRELGDTIDGKVVVDVTNALTPDYQLALGYSTSGAEEMQKKAPNAHVAKAFNTVFAANMDTGQVKGERLSAFVASDDDHAKDTVLEMARAIGFDAVDAGPLRNARLLEPLGYFNIQLGMKLGMGSDIGFELVH
jgi:predicted dinucleotide-binding enzyme